MYKEWWLAKLVLFDALQKPVCPLQKPLCPSKSDWVYTLDIPEVFSAKTMKILRSGEAVTKNARIEIVAALHTRMLQFQEKPSPFEYRTVCKRLVEKYPALQDQSDSGYVSDYCAFVVCVCVCACLIEAYACGPGNMEGAAKAEVQEWQTRREEGTPR